jgi:ABC-2 type transport system ATP-binding protein
MRYLIKCGIAKCTTEEFEKIDKRDYIRFKKNKYEYDVFVEDKKEFKEKYKIEAIDKPRIEDIMIMYVKGDR